MNFERLKLEAKDVVKVVTLALMLQGYYFAITGKIETMLIDAGYVKRIVEDHSKSFDKVNDKLSLHDIKLAKIFTMLYRDADKPKETKIEIESEE